MRTERFRHPSNRYFAELNFQGPVHKCEQALNTSFGVFSSLSSWSHSCCSRPYTRLYFLLWCLASLLSLTSRTCTDTSLACLPSRQMSLYNSRLEVLAAPLRARCHPSTSLLVLMARRYPDQVVGIHRSDVIHVSSTYWKTCNTIHRKTEKVYPVKVSVQSICKHNQHYFHKNTIIRRLGPH